MESDDHRPSIEVLLAHAQFVRALARSLVADESIVADIEQETWLAAMKHPPRGGPRAWLRAVVRNLAFRTHRSRERTERREHAAARPEALPSTVDLAARDAALREVVEAVRSLDDLHREVVLLRFYEDLPPREIAARLGVPVNTVRSRLVRALAALRERLDTQFRGRRQEWIPLLAGLVGVRRPGDSEGTGMTTAAAAVAGVAMGSKANVAAVVGVLALLAVVTRLSTSSPGVGEKDGGVPGGGSEMPGDVAGQAKSAGAAAQVPGPSADLPASAVRHEGRALRGKVVDADGRPVEEAEVVVAGKRTATDSEGRFVIEELSPSAGPVEVEVRARRFQPQSREATVLTRGGTAEETFVLAPDLEVAGRVVDDLGAPVQGARVFLLRPGLAAGEPLATSDQDGRFAVSQGSAGEWNLRVDPPGPAADWRDGAYLLVNTGDRDVQAVLRRRAPGRTRLRAEIVEALTGRPCSPTRVTVEEATARFTVGRGLRTTIADDAVSADGLWPGPWRLWVEVPGLALAIHEFSVREGEVEVAVRVPVSATGSIIGWIEFGDIPRPETVLVSARHEDAALSTAHRLLSRSMLPSGKARPDGYFAFPDLMPGRFQVTVKPSGGGKGAAGRVGLATVDVLPGETSEVRIALAPAGHIDFRTSGLVPGYVAELWLAAGDGAFELCDRYLGGGRVALGQSVPPGTYRWRMRFLADAVLTDPREAAAAQEGTVTVAAGEAAEVVVPVSPTRPEK